MIKIQDGDEKVEISSGCLPILFWLTVALIFILHFDKFLEFLIWIFK